MTSKMKLAMEAVVVGVMNELFVEKRIAQGLTKQEIQDMIEMAILKGFEQGSAWAFERSNERIRGIIHKENT